MSSYRPTIGLEVHAELKTRTKMFCDSRNAPHDSKPNTLVCPVCLAHPGTLPTVNREAVHAVLKVGAAVEGTLADYSEFDRKSYFYPDIPKNYQISQYEHPLVSSGSLNGVGITRVHLEEDTARSSHEGDKSVIDFNRAGVPLMELVTDPVISDAKSASAFAKELQLLLRTLDVSDANMERGEMRVEANISVSKDETLGTKVEVKNLNSFKAVERAIEFEIARQSEALQKGETVIQETRGWDEDKGKTFSQRLKEGSTDYRYFPEPDIPKLKVSEVEEWSVERLKKALPELPSDRRARLYELGVKTEDADTIASDIERSAYFDELVPHLESDAKKLVLAVNYLVNDIGSLVPPRVERFAELISMISEGEVSSRGAKELLKRMLEDGEGSPRALAREGGFLQNSDPESIKKVVTTILARETGAVAEYRAGKGNALQYLLGAVMKESGGSVNPEVTRKVLSDALL